MGHSQYTNVDESHIVEIENEPSKGVCSQPDLLTFSCPKLSLLDPLLHLKARPSCQYSAFNLSRHPEAVYTIES